MTYAFSVTKLYAINAFKIYFNVNSPYLLKRAPFNWSPVNQNLVNESRNGLLGVYREEVVMSSSNAVMGR